ncbi:MAG: hypothetical protein IPP93_04225 [Chitinophagaceae bacterium]|nr:hypothetical protein [Chitinophagaceae bacterium]
MKKICLSICLLIFCGAMNAQKINAIHFVLENTNAAMPFSKFSSLIGGVYHPGAEMAITKYFSRRKMEWAGLAHLGYFITGLAAASRCWIDTIYPSAERPPLVQHRIGCRHFVFNTRNRTIQTGEMEITGGFIPWLRAQVIFISGLNTVSPIQTTPS